MSTSDVATPYIMSQLILAPQCWKRAANNLIADYPELSIDALATDYLNGLAALPPAQRRLVLFLGSNLGNYTDSEQAELFTQLAAMLQPKRLFLDGFGSQETS